MRDMAREKKSFNVQKIEEVRDSLRALVGTADGLLATLKAANFPLDAELTVDAGDGMYKGLGAIAGWLSKLQDAHTHSTLPKPTRKVASDDAGEK